MAFVIAVSGLKNSGKTTLALKLISELKNRGLKVGYAKHTCENINLSPESSDSGKARRMGIPSALWSGDKVVMEMEIGTLACPELRRLFPGYDLVVLEGGKGMSLPKIWVGSLPHGDKLPPGMIASYNSCDPMPHWVKTFQNGQISSLAEYVLAIWQKRVDRDIEIFTEEGEVPVKEFVASFLSGGIRGMLKALKGVDLSKGISIHLKKGFRDP